MILQKVFLPSTIKTGLESDSKDELFEELVDVLAKAYPTQSSFPRQQIIDSLAKREAKMFHRHQQGHSLAPRYG